MLAGWSRWPPGGNLARVRRAGEATVWDPLDAIAGRDPGERIELTVRGSETLTLTATLGIQPTNRRSVPEG